MGVISMLQTAGGIGNTGFSASGAGEPATAARGAEITADCGDCGGYCGGGEKDLEPLQTQGFSDNKRGRVNRHDGGAPPLFTLFFMQNNE